MAIAAWTLHAYRLIEPDTQLDLFACQQVRRHLVGRQLELGHGSDRTLCGTLLPARILWVDLQRDGLRDPSLCPACIEQMTLQRQRQASGTRQAGRRRRRGLRLETQVNE